MMMTRYARFSSVAESGSVARNFCFTALPDAASDSRRDCSSCTTESAKPSARNPTADVATNTWITSHADCSAGGSGTTLT